MKYTAEALKARPDYKFNIYGLDVLIPEIRRGSFDDFDFECGRFELGVASCTVGSLSLEINVTSCGDRDTDKYVNVPVVSYFLCVRGRNEYNDYVWGDGGYMDDHGFETEVDFNRDDWKEQLEADMITKLITIKECYWLTFDGANFRRGDTFLVMDMINKTEKFGIFKRSGGGHSEHLASFNTYEEATEWCEERNWEYWDENEFVWYLEIEERW